MKKVIILSSEVFLDLTKEEKIEFQNFMNENISRGNQIVFTARENSTKLKLCEIEFNDTNKLFLKRKNLEIRIKMTLEEKPDVYFIVIGNKNHDLFLSARNKLFFVHPEWCNTKEEKAYKYGFKVTHINGLKLLIEIIENQQSWFYRLNLDDMTTILSLTNAGEYGVHSKNECEMIRAFRAILKNGEKNLYEVLLAHFLAAISSKKEFREINIWGILPSSGTELNKDMLIFKDKARELMNGRRKEPIFIRHTATFKSHDIKNKEKDRIPCNRHFDTIILNPFYKGKLKGEVVCLFDDYLTNGTTFETVRNILIKEKVKKIFLISLGRFGKKYIQQNYDIEGNVYERGYLYKEINKKNRADGIINNKAITEIEELHEIIYRK